MTVLQQPGLPFGLSGKITHLHRSRREADLVYLSLGSNLGDRQANLQAAIERVREAGTVRVISSIYEAEPVEFSGQPWFLNCTVALDTDLSPSDLLMKLLTIEREMGRVRLRDKGPRLIDIDIVLFHDLMVEERGLKIPHPAMHERRFVLAPLAEIAPDTVHPEIGKTVSEMLAALPAGQVVRRLQSVV